MLILFLKSMYLSPLPGIALFEGTVPLPLRVSGSPTAAHRIPLPGFAQQNIPLHLGPARRARFPSQFHRGSQREDLLLRVYSAVALYAHSALTLPEQAHLAAQCGFPTMQGLLSKAQSIQKLLTISEHPTFYSSSRTRSPTVFFWIISPAFCIYTLNCHLKLPTETNFTPLLFQGRIYHLNLP